MVHEVYVFTLEIFFQRLKNVVLLSPVLFNAIKDNIIREFLAGVIHEVFHNVFRDAS